MDAVTRTRVFEPFFTTKEVGKGTGLGLATAYGIVKQAHGHIFIDSELGRRSTFKVYLPRVATGPIGEATPLRAESQGGSETILLVDDDDGVRRMTRELLWQSGYRVLEAADGEEALLLCAREPGAIDMLLTDAIMPVMSGGRYPIA
ncbi:response regulator [Gemmata sp. G18]|uniref:histidine kinase n=2 Tax=Gemmata palustris TaxID=2822762 RepID=A0ABS5BSP7_9BACT|nr:response regulator [Gemmata palustris]